MSIRICCLVLSLLLLDTVVVGATESYASRRTERKKRDIESCPEPIPMFISMDPVQATMFTGIDAEDCALYSFETSTLLSSIDYLFQVTYEGLSTPPQIRMYAEGRYTGNWYDREEFRIDPEGTRIANCAVHYDKYYIKVWNTDPNITSSPVQVVLNISYTYPSTKERELPKGITDIEGTVHSGTDNEFDDMTLIGIWDYVAITTPNPKKPYRITMTDPPVGFLFLFSDYRCPTFYDDQGADLLAGGHITRFYDRPVYFAIYSDSTDPHHSKCSFPLLSVLIAVI